ncbi:1-(5-phosphoribosyl)-5-[(5-phosphoribosylamino)methylideneamino] imidazole-4-carboxamide isomerase, chloroplastic -like protein [Gossypium arboreum]|uniref:1-(5-phosphoribosyl)-5-[(5-phosphoribosylamino)methylideneamino] imidazole-4-carboxamide isomerase HISN3, chloroplastic n=1 Tax=Gossypium arboreum TaxID=29729 RepID=A0A0B0MW30_GOSAR|nr:1-(5-phosphoribosyl)-5-[(5-phosphoribosylamino)methylideneamino] imidazole-4-carboxamide isomerase, chloroplastic -like protein [Gossypium arboreum]KHG16061.1 1-(5-phosphoribosyl)-5-[(5-phosphoribosylamino)methylideneamino] imidazole-4-carboxamide isomerase, chloroplastic -like protein [Gossypium arboreum]
MRSSSLHGTSSIRELSSISHGRNFKSSLYDSSKHPFARAIPSLSFKSSHFCVRCTVSFRPCIDIHKGKVKQIVGSTLRDSKEDGSTLVTNFESDKLAAEFANLYKKDGLKGGHVIMLGADPLSQAAALEALRAYPGGLQVGGGINLDNCLSYIDEGASHVIVTSYVFNNGQMDLERLKGLVNVIGKQRLVLDLSCRKKEDKYAIVTDRWQKFSDVYLDEEVLNFLARFADEFLVHGVDVEGKNFESLDYLDPCSELTIVLMALRKACPSFCSQQSKDIQSSFIRAYMSGLLISVHKLGIDKDLVALLGEHSPIPVTYAGGVTVMDDLETIKAAGKGRVDVTVGSALDIFGGNLAYSDVVAWHENNRRGIN